MAKISAFAVLAQAVDDSVKPGKWTGGTEDEIAAGKRLLVGVEMTENFSPVAFEGNLTFELAENGRHVPAFVGRKLGFVYEEQ